MKHKPRSTPPKDETAHAEDVRLAPYVSELPSVSDIPRQELHIGFALRLRRDAGRPAAAH